MRLTFSNDLINHLGKTAVSLESIVNLPETERETIRQTLNNTDRLVVAPLNLVIIRSLPYDIRLDPGPLASSRSASIQNAE